MPEHRARVWTARRPRLARRVCAFAGLLLLASPALAQDQSSGALRFLKPWIERQLFGSETPEPDAGQAPEAAPEDGSSPSGEAAQAAPAEPGAEPSTDGEAPAAPDAAGGTDMELRGTDQGSGPAAGAAPAMDPVPGDSAEVPANVEDEPPGVPVEAKPEALRFAVLAGRSVAATMAAVGPVAEALQTALGRPVEILPLASYAAMIDAQVERRIDGGFYSAAAFAAADTGCACLEPLVAPRAADGTIAYHAVIMVRAGSGITSHLDLSGKTVAMGAVDSIGARRLQLAGLMAEGFDPATFGAAIEAESAEAAVRLVAAGRADAAFAWSSLAGGADAGYSSGTLSQLVAGGEVPMTGLALIWKSPPVTHGPFAVLRSLAEADKAKIEQYLLALSAASPSAYDRLDPFYGGGYAPVDAQDYAGFQSLLTRDVDALRLPAGPKTTGATFLAPGGAQPAPADAPAPD